MSSLTTFHDDGHQHRFLPFDQTPFGSLPFDVRRIILQMSVQDDTSQEVEDISRVVLWITTLEHKIRQVDKLFVWDEAFRCVFRGLLAVCRQLREDGRQLWISNTHTIFQFPTSSKLHALSRTFGGENTRMIKSLELEVDKDTDFPDLLNVLVVDLPQLHRLKLVSQYEHSGFLIHVPWRALNRKAQGLRPLLYLGVRLISCHQHLDRLILPATSGSGWGTSTEASVILMSNSHRHNTQTVSRLTSDDSTEESEDVLLDNMAIRRLSWAELGQVDARKNLRLAWHSRQEADVDKTKHSNLKRGAPMDDEEHAQVENSRKRRRSRRNHH